MQPYLFFILENISSVSVASSAGGALGDLESVSYPLLISVSAYIMGKNSSLHCFGFLNFLYVFV